MKDKILENANNELEIIELAKVQGFDQGAIDKLIIQWRVSKTKEKDKKKPKITK